MEESKNSLMNINKKLDSMNKNFNSLQDLILIVKKELAIIKKGIINETSFSKLSLTAQKQMIQFLDNKDPECKISDACVRLLEGGVYKILRIYSENGPDGAVELINKFLKTTNYEFYKDKCNNECLNRSIQIYHSLKELIITSRKEKIKFTQELIAFDDDTCFEEGVVENIYKILSPLSNVLRLKILTNLQNGGRTYSQLEEDIGIKAGHLLFHMEKLISIGYISQENKKYLITMKGLKILKYLHGLKEELFLKV
ncbi:MAG: winged helix-turn-helix domain-containing protein [Promethearchaeota archaeon]